MAGRLAVGSGVASHNTGVAGSVAKVMVHKRGMTASMAKVMV